MPGNSREVIRWLEDIVKSFNFKRRGVDQSLGRDLCHTVARKIQERSATTGAGADRNPWKANAPTTAEEKVQHYGYHDPPPPNFRTGQMLSELSLFGRPDVRETEIEMHYGIGSGPNGGCWSPSDNRTQDQIDADNAITDVEKAERAHDAGRKFYEPDMEMRDAVIADAADALNTYIREVN